VGSRMTNNCQIIVVVLNPIFIGYVIRACSAVANALSMVASAWETLLITHEYCSQLVDGHVTCHI